MAVARFSSADDENAPGRFEGNELLLPQAWLNAGGEQMYSREKEKYRDKEKARGRGKKASSSKADQGGVGGNRLRKKEKEQDK